MIGECCEFECWEKGLEQCSSLGFSWHSGHGRLLHEQQVRDLWTEYSALAQANAPDEEVERARSTAQAAQDEFLRRFGN